MLYYCRYSHFHLPQLGFDIFLVTFWRSDNLTNAWIKTAVFQAVTPCSLVDKYR